MNYTIMHLLTFLVLVVLNKGALGTLSSKDVSLLECDFNGETKNICDYEDYNPFGVTWNHYYKPCPDENCHMSYPPYRYGFMALNNTVDTSDDGKIAGLLSPLVSVTEPACLHFDYMNSACWELLRDGISTFNVSIRDKNGNDKLISEYPCVGHDRFYYAESIQLPLGEYRVLFSAMHIKIPTWKKAYVTLDDITITKGFCKSWVVNETNGDCSFQDLSRCGYTYTEDSQLRMTNGWKRQNGWLRDDFPKGKFLFIGEKKNKLSLQDKIYKSKVQSPELEITGTTCLAARYINGVEALDIDCVIKLFLKYDNGSEVLLKNLETYPGEGQSKWQDVFIPLPLGKYRLVIQMYVDSGYRYDSLAIDSVEIHHQECSQVSRLPDACNASTYNLCDHDEPCTSEGKKSFYCPCKAGSCYFNTSCTLPQNACLNRGKCIESSRRLSRCECQPGYHGDRCEHPVDCGPPPTDLFPNATLVPTNKTTKGNWAVYDCDPGNVYNSTRPRLFCFDIGGWSNKSGGCIYRDCGPPPNYTPRLLPIKPYTTAYGSEVRYKCNEAAYKRNSESWTKNVEKCKYNGEWTSDVSTAGCSRIPRCGPLPAPPHTTLVSVESHEIGGQAHYKCKPGYYAPVNIPTICRRYSYETFVWAPLPTCIHYCPVERGRVGRADAVQFTIQQCSSTGIDKFPAKENCHDETTHVAIKGEEKLGDSIVYFGYELCISVKVVKIIRVSQFADSTQKEETCYSFCLNPSNPEKRVVIKEEHAKSYNYGEYQNAYLSTSKTIQYFKLVGESGDKGISYQQTGSHSNAWKLSWSSGLIIGMIVIRWTL